MKHWRTRGSIKDGRRQPRFVFKKVNKQLISVVGSTLLLVGNYALIPIQVFANETPEITNEQPMSTESELPTLTTSESLPAGTPTDTTTPSTEKPPTADPAPEKPKTEPTTDTTDTDSLEPTEETKEKQLRMPPQAPTDWYAEEENGYMVIKSYNGVVTTITIPSEIDNKPVQIDLKAVLGSYVSGPGAATQTFKIEAAGNSGPVKLTGSFVSLFNGNPTLTSATFSDADFSEITDMSWMFNGCSSLSSVDVSNWDTANVRNMSNMFRDCSSLSSVDVSSWNTANVTDMSNMFHDCSSLSSLDVSNWNTANVNSMSQMFANCSSLSSLAVSNWNTANVTNMRYMFYNCSNLTSLDVSNWDTTNATNMTQMFTNCTKLSELTCSKTFIMATTQALRGLPAAENSGKTTYHWVMDDRKNSYDSTADLISGHNGLSDTDVHTYTIQKKHAVAFDTDGGSDAPAATTIWDQEVLADPDYKGTKNDHTFIGWKLGDQPYNFTQAVTQPLDLKADWEQAEWVTEDAGTYTRIIGYNGTGENIKVPSMLHGKPVEIDLKMVLGSYLTGHGAENETFEIEESKNGEKPVKITGKFTILFAQNSNLRSVEFSDADFSEITDMSYMFAGCSSLNSVDVSKWNMENVTKLESMFEMCSSLTSVDVSKWNTKNVKNMFLMFYGCSNLTSLDVSNWNTVNVTNMNQMFSDCSSLNSLDVSNWDTTNVTKMSYMFSGCSNLTSVDVSKWDTEKVEDMRSVFAGCSSLNSLDVSNWNTANVTDMTAMFAFCSNLSSLDMSNWDTTKVTSMNEMFFKCPNLSELTCSKSFEMDTSQALRGLPTAENSGKTTYHWVMDDRKNSYDTTADLISGHNGLSDTKAHTYTIQKKHAVTFDADGGSDAPSATTIWDNEKVADPDYKGKKRDHTFIGWKVGDQPYDFSKQVTEPLELKADWRQGEWITEDAGGYTKIIGYNGTGENIKVPSILCDKPVQIDLGAVLGQYLGGPLAKTQTFEIEAAKNGELPVKVTGSFANLFDGNTKLTSAKFADADTSEITNMMLMFANCSNLSSVDVSNWNTANVTDMSGMFVGCSSLSSLDMSNWNTANVTDMSGMFVSCSNLTSLDISNWDTTNGTNMNEMFDYCPNLSKLTCSKTFKMDAWQTLRGLPAAENNGKTTYHWVMDDREKSYDSTTDLISGHNGLSDTKAHTYTIQKKHAVSFDVDGGSDSPSATTIWDKGKVADPDYKGTKRDHTFIGWKAGDQPYDFSKQVTEPLELKADWKQGEWVTEDAGAYTKIIGYNGTGETIKVPSILYNKPVEIDLGAVLGSSMSGTFAKTKTFEIEAAKNGEKPVKVTGSFANLFDENTKLTSAKFADADTSAITNMGLMFNGCVNLSSVDVSKWDTANVKSMNHMFFNCISLNSLDVSKWDTEKVEDMRAIFSGCSSLNSLDASNWNTTNVTDMANIFAFCGNLTTLDISNWDTANVTNMSQMFDNCSNLSELTCSKSFKMEGNQALRGLPSAENNGKTTYHWVMDDRKNSYDSTNDLISGHNGLSDTKAHSYTIQKKHAVTFDTDGGSEVPAATTIWDKEKVADPDYKGKKRDHTFTGWKSGDKAYDFSKQVTEPLELKADWKQGEWVTEDAGTYTRIIGYNGTGENIKVPSILHGKPVEIDLGAVLGSYLNGITQTFEIEAAKNGELPVKVTGSFEDLFNNNRKLTSAKFADADTSAISNLSWMFSDCNNLSSLDVSNLNTTNVLGMTGVFYGCSSLSSLDVSKWNTANVIEIRSIFSGCSSLTSLDLTKWNTENVSSTSQMFANCNKLSELTCSKSFKMTDDQALHGLPTAENDGKTTYHWVMDDGKESYDSTTDLVSGHNGLSDTKAHTYDIQKKHEVAFNVAGGSPEVAAKKVLENKTVTDPNYQGTKANHQFDGWTLDGKPFDFDQTKITAPIQLTAAWRLNQYSIQFDKNGGTGTMQGQTLTYDEEKTLLPNAFNRTGYTFAGWNTQADGQGERSYTDQQAVKNLSAEDGETVTLYAQWRAHTYQIDFDPNTGEGTQAPQELRYDQEAKLAENHFTKKGYSFNGWNTQKDGNGKAYTNTETVKNLTAVNDAKITLFAQWTRDTYTITFDSNGGEAVSDKKYTIETESFTLPELKRKGYTFHGWYDDETKVETIEKGTTGNKALVAKWEAIEYSVTFDSAGGSDVPVQHYTIEKGLADFTTPTKKGYTFQGWYDGKDKVEAIKTGETGDRMLTAKWTMNTYTITFDSKGGEAVSDKKYTVETESFKLPELGRKGYTFHGWYDGETKIETIEKGTTGNKSLVAKWEAIEYNVTFDSAGGSNVPVQHYTIEKGLTNLTTPTRKGYTFQGWYDGKDKVESIKTGETGDRTLTAKWTMNTYTITFNDATLAPITYTVESENIVLPKKERLGYTFLGWRVSEETLARAVTDQGQILQTIPTGTTGNLRLSAQWQANSYEVIVDPNGGAGTRASQRLTYDKAEKLAKNTFTRDGYSFTGWNTQADGKGTAYTDQQEVKNLVAEANGSLTLFAQWKPTKAALEDVIAKEQEAKRDKNKYTKESWDTYEKALANAKKVLADANAAPEQIRAALAELTTAIAQLKPIENASGKTSGSTTSPTAARKTYPTSAKRYPPTGMLTGSGLTIIGIAAVGTALASWKKRNKKD